VLRSQIWSSVLVAAVLCLVTFVAGGGIGAHNPGRATTIEMALTIGAGVVIATSVVLAPAIGRLYGLWALVGLLALTTLSGLSIGWSVAPDSSWEDAGRMLAYSGVFATALVLARVAPGRWPSVLGGIALAGAIVCGYALLTKVFPAQLDASDPYARLRAPYGYWNATGLTAALTALTCLWLGSRRAGNRLLTALAYPGLGLALVTLLLAYSRGALAALAVGLLLWFCMLPLRLRSAAVLIPSGVCAALVVAFDFHSHALSTGGAPLAERAAAGHRLGVLLVAMVLALAVVGVAIGFLSARHPPSPATRRSAGTALLCLVGVVLIAFVGALGVSRRGLTGTISHTVSTLVNPNAPLPPNDTPGRLTSAGSVRARYWKEALDVFKAHPGLGTGARTYGTAHLRYRGETLEVRDAHGYIVQTMSDLGTFGLALTLALLGAWLVAAGRATHPFDRRWRNWRWRRDPDPEPYTPERIGMLAMLCVVVTFGVHSFADWTWFVPGNACVALLCAGWLAGRGPLGVRTSAGVLGTSRPAAPSPNGAGHDLAEQARRINERVRARLREPAGRVRAAIALATLLAAFLAAWAQWQPARSVEAAQAALATDNHAQAIALAETAVSRDSLSVEARETLAAVQERDGRRAAARATLAEAVRLQPNNPQTWFALGRFDLPRDPRAALAELGAVVYLNPMSISAEALASGDSEAIEIHNDYLEALRRSAALLKRSP
jgi:tetratricopeptide (TPR) repeat protein